MESLTSWPDRATAKGHKGVAVKKVQSLRAEIEQLDALDPDVDLLLALPEDERPLTGLAGLLDWRMGGELSRCLQSGLCTGASGEQVLLSTRGRVAPRRLFVFGVGPQKKLKTVRADFAEAVRACFQQAGTRRAALLWPERDVHENLRSVLSQKLDCQELFIFSEHVTMKPTDH